MPADDPIRLDFICRKNAGRSQMAAAFAERERDERGLDDAVEIHSAGTEPADRVHGPVVDAMAEVGIDLSGETPSYPVLDHLRESHFLISMGCTVNEFNPAQYGVESREWELTNPEGEEMDVVRSVRDEIEARVHALFDEIEQVADERPAETSLSERVTAAVRDALPFGKRP